MYHEKIRNIKTLSYGSNKYSILIGREQCNISHIALQCNNKFSRKEKLEAGTFFLEIKTNNFSASKRFCVELALIQDLLNKIRHFIDFLV